MNQLPSIKELLARRSQTGAQPSASNTPTNVKTPFMASQDILSKTQSPAPSTQSTTNAAGVRVSISSSVVQTPTGKITLSEDEEITEKLQEKITNIARRESEDETIRRASSLGLPTINLKGFPISPEALQLIPEAQAKALGMVAFFFNGAELRVAATDPQKPQVEEVLFQLTERNKTNGKLYMMSEESLGHAIRLYDALPKISAIVKGVEITEEDLKKYQESMQDIAMVNSLLSKANVTDMITVVIAAAVKFESSDIHVEAEEGGIIVRLRIDGMLQEIAKIDKEQWKKIINRIKLIASVKMNVTNQAQDGRFTIFQQNKKIDVRVSTIPTSFGESVVMRLLNPNSIALSFNALGFRPAALKKILHEVERPNGMIITTGPTGSGKTTTLYAVLNKLNTKDVKIITLEDPVEYKLEGINQSQIDASRDYTFAKGLRSILRQDPDIVMVGEIRDLETAETAIQAALTGHLLLSTIHTNDAAGAIPRFLSMGVAPHLLAPAINAIMGQRLVRKLCSCKQIATLTPEQQELVKKHLETIPANSGESVLDSTKITWYAPKGCTTCNESGYKGRIGVYEILIKDPTLEQAILKSNGALSEYEMRDIAKGQGMITMVQDGLLKASEGLTSINEIQRIVGL
jgi:type II secretory ATPase GspE/PulE/Tfp pilus assembly ATPase PilB-like protein